MGLGTYDGTRPEQLTNEGEGESSKNTKTSGDTAASPVDEAGNIGLIALANCDDFSYEEIKNCFGSIAARLALVKSDCNDDDQKAAKRCRSQHLANL